MLTPDQSAALHMKITNELLKREEIYAIGRFQQKYQIYCHPLSQETEQEIKQFFETSVHPIHPLVSYELLTWEE